MDGERDPYTDYLTINEELKDYGAGLEERPQIVVASKMDCEGAEERKAEFDKKTGIVSYGNPDLDIVKTHQLGAVYNLFTPKFLLSANLSYDFSSNGIDQYVFYQDGLLNATFGNITKSRNLNLTLFSTITVSPKGKLILNLTNRYTDLRSQSLNAKRSGWTLSGSAGLQQELPLFSC